MHFLKGKCHKNTNASISFLLSSLNCCGDEVRHEQSKEAGPKTETH